MADLQHVGGPPSRIDRYLGRIIVVVLAGVLVAVVKPWGGAPEPLAAAPTPSPSSTPVPTSSIRHYDFLDYGILEPQPMWEIWSAGTLSSYSFALRIDLAPADAVSSSPAGSGIPGSPSASPLAEPSGARANDIPAVWPEVHIPPGSHLELIAINHPIGHAVDVIELVRVNDDGTEMSVPVVPSVSPWPNHLTVVGLGADDGTGAMSTWPPGHYRMDLRIGPEGAARSLEIVVDTLPTKPEPSATPVASASPGT